MRACQYDNYFIIVSLLKHKKINVHIEDDNNTAPIGGPLILMLT